MATTDDKAALLALRARIDERFIAPFRRDSFAHRTWFMVAVAFVFAVHAAILGVFLYRDWTAPPETAKEQATPVEVVMQQPPPPPPPPQQRQQQKPKQEIEKPATSAPRAENDAKTDTDKADKDTRAPKAETPPTDGDPQPAKDSAQTNKDTADADAEAAAENPDVQKDAEALDKAAPTPPQDKPKPAKAKVAAKPKRATSSMQQLAGLSDLPDYHFAKHTKKSPISGGNEDSRYLAIVYGLISSRIHFAGEGAVTVTFELGNNGEVLDIGLLASSGDQMADAEVINAVRHSSPFPPPPPDRPHSLRATIDFSRHPMSMGAR